MTGAGATMTTLSLPLTPWQRQLRLLGAAALAILLLFHRDAIDIVAIWWNSASYGHCLFMIPIIGWLTWQRRDGLIQLTPRNWAPGLLLAAAGAGGWLLGDAAGVAVARHFGLVMMLQGSVIALLGPAVSRGLMFPIFYMLFMVPFGEQLVPPLQTVTAQMCMVLLGWVGIPAHIDGVFITTPSGYFEVAEACSGVNFLIAMLAYAVLAANVCFIRWGRRILFVIGAVAMSILANGVRAWGTIYISSLTSIDFAAGFDHVFYGWIFFALVLAIVMGIGWRYFDRPGDAAWFDPAALRERTIPDTRRWTVPIAVLAIAVTPVLWGAAIAATGRTPLPHPIDLPQVAGWQRVPLSAQPWAPRYDGADHRLLGRYRNAAGEQVELGIFLFGYQAEGRELVGFGRGAVDPASDWAWMASAPAHHGGLGERITAPGVTREVVTYYRLGGIVTGSPTRVKWETLKMRLFGGDQRAIALVVSAEDVKGRDTDAGIARFLAALGPVDRLSDSIAAEASAR